MFYCIRLDPKCDTTMILDGKKVIVPQGKPEHQPKYKSSQFGQSEYLIYREDQCRIRYLLKLKFWRAWHRLIDTRRSAKRSNELVIIKAHISIVICAPGCGGAFVLRPALDRCSETHVYPLFSPATLTFASWIQNHSRTTVPLHCTQRLRYIAYDSD